ncbi:hypothetical protein DSECCO2_587680 [anaerobic digester metagenome]
MVKTNGGVDSSCAHHIPGCNALFVVIVNVVMLDDRVIRSAGGLIGKLDCPVILRHGAIVAHFIVMHPGIAVLRDQNAVLHGMFDDIVMHVHHRGVAVSNAIEMKPPLIVTKAAIGYFHRRVHRVDPILRIFHHDVLEIALHAFILKAQTFPEIGGWILRVLEIDAVGLGTHGLNAAFRVDSVVSSSLEHHSR